MKTVELSCKVHLQFEDGDGFYFLSSSSPNKQLNEISVSSPVGKAILGRNQGEDVEFLNSSKQLVRVKILRVDNERVLNI